MNKKNRNLLNSIFSSVAAVIFLYLCADSVLKPIVTKTFGSTNLPAFALSILFFIALFILFGKIQPKYSGFHPIFLLSGICFFLILSYAFEKREVKYPPIEFYLPTGLMISFTVILFIIFCLAIKNGHLFAFLLKIKKFFSSKAGIVFLYGTIAALIILSAYNQYNIIYFDYFDEYHLHAYFNSITNIFWGQPYTETVTSIYGHYAFFYYPFLKLAYHLGFHNIYKAYMMLSTMLVAATLLIWIKIIFWNVRNKLILFLGVFTICHVNTARIVYLFHQLYPHRSFPVAVTALMIALWYRSKGKKRKLVTFSGYFISMLLTIWSVEYGIFSIISWAALHICTLFQQNKKNNWQFILLHLAAIPFTFLSAVYLCGLINMVFGGSMIPIRDFVFPLLEKEHMIGFHELPLPNYPSAWMSITFLIFCLLGYGLKDTWLCNSTDHKKSDQSAACFSISVLSLGSLTYPINRPAYTEFYIILPIAGLFMSIMAETFLSDIRTVFRPHTESKDQIFQGSISFISAFVLTLMMVCTLVNIPHKLKVYQPYKNSETIDEIIAWLTDIRDTPGAVGIGNTVNFVYAYLGWDPEFYSMDSSNYHINQDSHTEIIEKTKNLTERSVFAANDINYDLSQEFLETHWMYSMWKNDDVSIYCWIPKN